MNTVRNQARRTLVGLAAAAVAIPLAVGAAPVAGAVTSDATVTMLQAMASEEKLAHDVYTTLAETYSGSVFARIASSEAHHKSALLAVMSVRGIADPNAGLPVGDFASAKWENLYDSLVAKGEVSLKAAGGVGVTIEKLDISDLDLALAMKPASDITRVLQNLRGGSTRHLTSFQRVVSGYTR